MAESISQIIISIQYVKAHISHSNTTHKKHSMSQSVTKQAKANERISVGFEMPFVSHSKQSKYYMISNG